MIAKIVNKIMDNIVQIIELVIMIVVFIFPRIIDANGLFSAYINTTSISPNNFFVYILLQCNNWIIGTVSMIFVWWMFIRKYNRENVTMNKGNVYHSYPYWWYWFSAFVLDIKKCNLKNVPIYMQVNLVVNELFNEYPLDEKEYPETEEEVKVEKKNFKQGISPKEINVILEDTYPLDNKQIPRSKLMLPTLKIYRENVGENTRHYSEKLVETVASEIRNLPDNIIVNLFATLNPMNAYYISKGVFTMSDRGNVEHLYVYQQSSKNGRHFKEKGSRIY